MSVYDISKIDEEQRVVYGWASVTSVNGTAVIDKQDDIIEEAELLTATTEFMKDQRTALSMHKGEGIGQVVHSFPLVGSIMKSLNISSDMEGWIVGVHVSDDKIWKSVKDGELKAFSIGGSGIREDA